MLSKKALGDGMSDREWILLAIQDLQELANQHAMERVAEALDDVFYVARTELNTERKRKASYREESSQHKTGEVVIFPSNRNLPATWF